MTYALLVSVFVIASCGLVYELIAGTLASYLRGRLEFKDLVSEVLTFDYLGALIASLLFPIVLAPKLGLVRTCFLFGILNVVVAGWTAWLFRAELPQLAWVRRQVAAVTLLLLAGFVYANRLTAYAEEGLYADDVIFARSSPYQRIVLTRWRDDLRLFLNGHLQFSSRDEYRYHETLVHPALGAVPHPRTVLVLGGGDGLAVREILKYPS